MTDFPIKANSSAPTRGIPSAFPDSLRDSPTGSDAARPHVLVVDDETLIADSVAAILNRSGYDAVPRYCGLDAIQYLEQRRPDIIVTDVMLPDIDGVRVAMSVRALFPDTRIVLFSGNTETAQLLKLAASEGNSFELLAKPVHPAQLLKTLRAC